MLAAAGMPVTIWMFVSPPAYFCMLKSLRSVNRAANDQERGAGSVDDTGGAVNVGCGVVTGVRTDERSTVVDGTSELLGAAVTQLTSVIGGGVIKAVTMRVTVSMGTDIVGENTLLGSTGPLLSPSIAGSNRGVKSAFAPSVAIGSTTTVVPIDSATALTVGA